MTGKDEPIRMSHEEEMEALSREMDEPVDLYDLTDPTPAAPRTEHAADELREWIREMFVSESDAEPILRHLDRALAEASQRSPSDQHMTSPLPHRDPMAVKTIDPARPAQVGPVPRPVGADPLDVERMKDALLRLHSGDVPGATQQEKAGLQYAALWLAGLFKVELLATSTEGD